MSTKDSPYVIGVDGGGTKTLAVAATLTGEIIAAARSGPANYQSAGKDVAASNIRQVISEIAEITSAPRGCLAVYYALSGADRPLDFEIIEDMIGGITPSPPWPHWEVDNDALAPLALGSEDGTGVVVICGTGTNCIGINATGQRKQVGGLSPAFGDAAGGSVIGIRAYSAAIRGEDGRGRPTLLSQLIRSHIGSSDLLSVVHHTYADGEGFAFSSIAPLVFEAAERGDSVAVEILIDNGRELGISALAALRELFSPEDAPTVVLAGSIAQNPNPITLTAVREAVLPEYPNARIMVPTAEPVLGAVLLATRLAGKGLAVESSREFMERLEHSYSTFDRSESLQ
jgi:N-acetylglucosamine kinase-like BadF-type ATPase